MTAIKEIPTNFRVYYTSMREAYTQKKEEAIKNLKDLNLKLDKFYTEVKSDFEIKGSDYDIDLYKYEEFIKNKYITGEFLRVAKGFFINKSNNYELVGSRYSLYALAKIQKDIADTENRLVIIDKMLKLKLNEYKDILKVYYNKVHEKLICDGYGYAFENGIGWTCINRCHLVNKKLKIDYQKTKAKKAQLLAEGKRIRNKEEEAWCKENGLEYNAEDFRVYQNIEYCYEIPLIGCKLPNGTKQKFTIANRLGRNVRGKSREELIKECNYDIRKVCELDVDVREKLDICLLIDKMLYTKFIRNENQKASVIK